MSEQQIKEFTFGGRKYLIDPNLLREMQEYSDRWDVESNYHFILHREAPLAWMNSRKILDLLNNTNG